MARIREYTTQESAGATINTPRVEAGGFGTGLASAAEGLYSYADAKTQVAQRQEVSDIQAQIAQKRAEWTVALEKRAAESDPGDPGFADRFVEDFKADLAPLGDKYQTAAGQRAWKQSAGEVSAYFVAQAGVKQAVSAGIKAQQDFLSARNFNRTALLNDPGQFDSVVATTVAALNDPDGPYAKIPADKRAVLERTTREEMALSAVQGIIDKDPHLGLKEIANPKWAQYLDADKVVTLKREAEIGIRAEEVERARVEAAAEKAAEKQRQGVMDGFVQKLYDPAGPSLTTQDVLKSSLKAEQKEHFIKLIEATSKPTAIKTDPAAFQDAFTRMRLPADDPQRISDERQLDDYFTSGKITFEDLGRLRTEFSGRRTAEGQIEGKLKDGLLAVAKSTLTKTNSIIGIRTPKGDEALQGFTAWFLNEYDTQRKAGVSALELLSPDSPKYLGKMIDKFKVPLTDVINDALKEPPKASTRGNPKPKAPAKEYPTPTTRADFDALPSGATYRDPEDNKLYRKP